MTKVVSKEAFSEVVNVLKDGGIVAFPTDTVYGIGIKYNSLDALERMKAAKDRDKTKPFPLMVASSSQLSQVAFLQDRDIKIVDKLTPGGLTLVLKKKDIIDDRFTNGKDTIAIRIPDDEFVLKLLNEVGPMFVTSANISGQNSCNDDKEVLEQLDGRIEMIVKGHARSGVASTIIDCTDDEIKILRQGEITIEDINQAILGDID